MKKRALFVLGWLVHLEVPASVPNPLH